MTGTVRVLVVDDDDLNLEFITAYLELEAYTVESAVSGEQALQMVKQSAPDIILLDVRMRGIDGYETCRRLKADPLTRHIPVLMVTGYQDDSDIVTVVESGADDLIGKPIQPLILRMRVRSLVRMKQYHDQLNA